jgi:hypothetical protein
MMRLIHLDLQQRKAIEPRRHATRGRRIYEWLAAVLWVAGGKDRFDVADLLGCSVRQVAEWLRLYRNAGLDALCTSMYYMSLVILKPSFSIRLNQPSIPSWPFRSKGK